MHIEELRDYCLSLPGASERFPFDDKTYVFFVAEKMFCATNIETFTYINVKCDPERAIELRERYPDVVPGFHMNKKHWNSIRTTGNLPDHLIKQWIRDSYDLVVARLPKRIREVFSQE